MPLKLLRRTKPNDHTGHMDWLVRSCHRIRHPDRRPWPDAGVRANGRAREAELDPADDRPQFLGESRGGRDGVGEQLRGAREADDPAFRDLGQSGDDARLHEASAAEGQQRGRTEPQQERLAVRGESAAAGLQRGGELGDQYRPLGPGYPLGEFLLERFEQHRANGAWDGQ